MIRPVKPRRLDPLMFAAAIAVGMLLAALYL